MSPGVTENTLSLANQLEVEQYLSAAELGILQDLWAKHKGDHKWDMVDITHEFPEWNRKAKEANTSFPCRSHGFSSSASKKARTQLPPRPTKSTITRNF